MIIGIDIDDTLVSSSETFDRLIKKYNIAFFKKWNDEWTQEERGFIFGNYLEEVLFNVEIKKDAKEVLDYLVNKGYKLIIITSRSNKYCNVLEQKTLDFIKESLVKSDINIIDLPGIYSFSPYTPEEVISRNYILT